MAAGRTIGNYVLGELLGRGGMSDVHAAEHRFLGDRVAIKLLRSHLAADPAAAAAFVAEATRTRAIDHANVVRVLDFGSDGDAFYLVMERLDGESLAARLARVGRLDEPEVRRLGAAIADGAAAAHDRGIVHRDLKPGNIVLVADQPRIIDFGIARELARAAVTGSRAGTVAYMAPEQLTGGLIAPCVDIWALGVVLYEALAGRLPFDGFADGRSPQLFETPPRLGTLAAVSPALEALIACCLDRDPARRPPSMRAIADALRDGPGEPRVTEELHPQAGRGADLAGADQPPSARSAGRDPAELSNHAPPDPTAGTPGADAPHAVRSATRGRRSRVGVVAAVAVFVVASGLAGAMWPRPSAVESAGTPGAMAVPAADSAKPAGIAPPAGPRPASMAAQPAPAPSPPSDTTGAAAAPPVDTSRPAPPPWEIAAPAIAALPPPPASPPGDTPAAMAVPAADSANPARIALPAGPRPASMAAQTPTAVSSAAPQKPAAVAVEVRSTPAGASVVIGGKRVGVTPATLALELPASIVVSRAGYRPSRLRAERAGRINVRLVPLAPARPRRAAAGETLD